MTTLHVADRSQRFEEFVLERCTQHPRGEDSALCKNIAKYNNRVVGGIVFPGELILVPEQPDQYVCKGLPLGYQLASSLSPEHANVLGELLNHNTGEEVLAMAEIWDNMPNGNDTFKAFAGAALGASKSRGEALNNAVRRYNDALVKWKNTPNHKDRQRVNMRVVKPAFDDLQRVFGREVRQIADRKPRTAEQRALLNRRRATRHLRHKRNSLKLNDVADIQRLQKFLKAAKLTGWGAIVIDAGLAAQKVGVARENGGGAGRIAYEEYAALIGGVLIGGMAAAALPVTAGLFLITLAGGVGALVGAESGRRLGRFIHDQISTYEAALPVERRRQLLSGAAMSVL